MPDDYKREDQEKFVFDYGWFVAEKYKVAKEKKGKDCTEADMERVARAVNDAVTKHQKEYLKTMEEAEKKNAQKKSDVQYNNLAQVDKTQFAQQNEQMNLQKQGYSGPNARLEGSNNAFDNKDYKQMPKVETGAGCSEPTQTYQQPAQEKLQSTP